MSMSQAEITEVTTKNASRGHRNKVRVLKGTTIEFDPNQHTGEATEIITKDALRKRRNKVTVLKGTAIEFDPNQHTGQATEIITKSALWQRRNTVTVLKGTTIEFDPKLHTGQATEIITKSALSKRRNTVKVLKGTAIEFDPNQHAGQSAEIITKSTFRLRHNTVKVLKGTTIEFDPKQHTGQATEIITKSALNKRRNKVKVLKGTAILFDPKLHAGEASEIITKNTLTKRRNTAKVVKGTGILFDPVHHAGEATEIITKNNLYQRRNTVTVLKGTAILFDPNQHTGQAIETITKNAFYQRRNKVKVLKGTAILFDPVAHAGQATEIITKSNYAQRCNTVKVLKGTAIEFDPVAHAGEATEIITKSAFSKRLNKVMVLKGTAIEFDPKLHDGDATEIISKNTLYQRRNTVTVLKGTAIEFDPKQHTGQATEIITLDVLSKRRNKVTVLKGTAILFDPVAHAGQATEIITKSALSKRRRKVKVLKGTAIEFDPVLHAGQATEIITKSALYQRRNRNKKAIPDNPENPRKRRKLNDLAKNNLIIKLEPQRFPSYHDNFNRNIIVLEKNESHVPSFQHDDLNKIIILMDEDETVNAHAISSNHQRISTAQMLPTKAERGKYQGKTVAWMIHDRYTALCHSQPNYAKKNQCTINLQGKKVRIIINEVLISLDNPDNNLTVMPLNKSLNKPIKMLDLRFVDPTDHNQIYIRAGMSQNIFTITLLHNSDLFGSFNNLFQGILKHLKSYQKPIILQDDARKTGQFLDLSCCVAGKQNPLYERSDFYPVTGTVTIPSYLDPNNARWATAYRQTGQAQDALKAYYATTPFTQFLLTQNINVNRINQKLMQVSIIYNINDTVQMVHHRILAKMKAAEQNQNEKIKQELLNITEEYLYQRLKINIPAQNNQETYSPLFFHVPLATTNENYHNISNFKVNDYLINQLIKHYIPMANALAQEAYKQYLYLVANAYAPIKAYVPPCLLLEEVKRILNWMYDCNIQSLPVKKHSAIQNKKANSTLVKKEPLSDLLTLNPALIFSKQNILNACISNNHNFVLKNKNHDQQSSVFCTYS